MGTGPTEQGETREIPTSRTRPPTTDRDPGRRRMSSPAVRLGMIGALSLTVAACGADNDDDEEVTAYCVEQNSYESDGSYEVVDDDNCDDDTYHGSHGGYFWYYGGRSYKGSRIHKGTTVKPKGATITSTSGKTIQRGGFGGRSSSGS